MSQALRLARQGIGLTKPNPCVGALIVKENKVVGKGSHLKAGHDHAEVIAIQEAGSQAKGADLYVTLEPCNHQGKTPPCASAIVKAGILRVYIATQDPNSLVSGNGIKYLKQNKIEVVVGILKDEAIEINRGFFYRMEHARPFIRSKIAASLDGRTSLVDGTSQWITSEASRQDVQLLRSKSCAILTGVGTINKDDPSLTVRSRSDTLQPIRLIVDSHLSINTKAKILHQSNVHLLYGNDPYGNLAKLKKTNATIIQMALIDNQIDLNGLMEYLNQLEINDLLVEAGPTLNGVLLKMTMINELITYTAPILLGGNANPMFNFPVLKSMKDKVKLSIVDTRVIGSDIRITSRLEINGLD